MLRIRLEIVDTGDTAMFYSLCSEYSYSRGYEMRVKVMNHNHNV